MSSLACLTFGFSCLVFPFIYNRMHVKELVRKGFKVKSVQLGSANQISSRAGIQLEELAGNTT